jgi:hypothetical protein
MTRSTLSAAYQAEAIKGAVRVAEFLELAFPGGTIRVTTADRDVVWGGFTWTASALMRDYGGVSESSDNKPRRIALRLSGVDTALVTRIRTDAYHYARVQIYLGLFEEAWALVGDPYAFGDELLMSSTPLTLSQGDAAIELSAETWDIFGERDSAVLATPESQKLRYAGDTGMDKVVRMMTQEVEWGGEYTTIGATRPTK